MKVEAEGTAAHETCVQPPGGRKVPRASPSTEAAGTTGRRAGLATAVSTPENRRNRPADIPEEQGLCPASVLLAPAPLHP